MNKKHHRTGLSAAGLALALSGIWASASAQTASPPPSTAYGIYDSIAAAGQTLASDGIYLDLNFHENVGALLTGGLKTGVQPVDQINGFATFDLQTILGIPGASFHLAFDQRGGEGTGTLVGTSALLQYDQEALKIGLSQFFWEQAFDGDRLDIEAGRMQPTFDFMFNDLSCAFASSIMCAQFGTFYFSQNTSPFGYTQWGGRVNFQITPNVYIRAGLYNEDPSQAGFLYNGLNWNTEHTVGTFLPVQVGYHTGFKESAYPSNYYLGYYHDSAPYTLANGQPSAGREAFWGWAEQTVWRPDRATNQSLTAFAGFLTYSKGSPFWGQFIGGLWDRAPFGTRRPADAVGVIASLYVHDQAYASGYARPNTDQWALEVDYSATLAPGITLQPYAQYIINPDNPSDFMNSSGSTKLKNAFLIGFEVTVSLGQFFQFPEFVPH